MLHTMTWLIHISSLSNLIRAANIDNIIIEENPSGLSEKFRHQRKQRWQNIARWSNGTYNWIRICNDKNSSLRTKLAGIHKHESGVCSVEKTSIRYHYA